jgi:ElaB/YqjD/DUF883 family membrane-anchored ribosome-binding protein
MSESTQPQPNENAVNPAGVSANSLAPDSQELERRGNELMVLAQKAREESNDSLADELLRQAQDLFAQAKLKGAEWINIANEQTQSIRNQATQYTQQNPLKAVGIAALFGILIGLLFKGRKKKN